MRARREVDGVEPVDYLDPSVEHLLKPILERTQGVILTKAALNMMGLPGGHTRLPLVDATEDQIAQLRKDLIAGGISL